MLALGLGLTTASPWGVADFLGGLQARRLPLVVVMGMSQLAAATLISVLILIFAGEAPTTEEYLLAVLAGLFSFVGVSAAFASLAMGSMSIASPIAASGVALPVIWGLATGDSPSPLELGGVLATFAGALIVASPESGTAAPRNRADRTSIALAVAATPTFGVLYILFGEMSDTDGLWVLFDIRLTSALIAGIGFLYLRPSFDLTKRSGGVLIALGAMDLIAQASLLAANSLGLVSIVSVVASVYTVVTVLMARLVLREVIAPKRAAGIAVVAGGVMLIAAGSGWAPKG